MIKKESCTESGGRMIYNCGFDTAGQILTHLLPNIDGSFIQAKDLDWMTKGQMMKFDQREFVDSWPFEYTGLADDGYVYFPDQCIDGATKCKVVVFLHGGNQSVARSNERVLKTSGFGDYAPSNNLIVLFP